MKYNFTPQFWSNNSTKVQFEPLTKMPSEDLVTSCMVFVVKDDSVLLSRPERGWGLPGGHKEANESPEACAVREVFEEASVKIKNLRLVGGWKAEKIKHVEQNSKYPDLAYQLLFLADVDQVCEFKPEHETLEREFIKYDQVKNHHHNYERFSEILAYMLDCLDNKDGKLHS